MKQHTVWMLLGLGFILYVAAVYVIGFEGRVALAIHFARFAVGVTVLAIYIPSVPHIFSTVPAPGRDYLITGIILTWLSNDAFSLWNEAGRLWGVDTSVFTNPVAGFLSLVVLTGGLFHIVAPSIPKRGRRLVAVSLGLISSTLLVFVAPMFR